MTNPYTVRDPLFYLSYYPHTLIAPGTSAPFNNYLGAQAGPSGTVQPFRDQQDHSQDPALAIDLYHIGALFTAGQTSRQGQNPDGTLLSCKPFCGLETDRQNQCYRILHSLPVLLLTGTRMPDSLRPLHSFTNPLIIWALLLLHICRGHLHTTLPDKLRCIHQTSHSSECIICPVHFFP